MDRLIAFSVFRLLSCDDIALYRVIVDDVETRKTAVVRIDAPDPNRARGGRRRLDRTKRPRKKSASALTSRIVWLHRDLLESKWQEKQLHLVDVEIDMRQGSHLDPEIVTRRLQLMRDFLDARQLQDTVLRTGGIGSLVREAVRREGAARSTVYRLFGALCRLGFVESSLRSRLDLCGAPGVSRPCDEGRRAKAGRKTTKQRIARAHGIELPSEQPGITSQWKALILAADAAIPSPKPAMPARCTAIINSGFVQRYRDEKGILVPVDPDLGTYPNRGQIQRVLEHDKSALERLLEQTTRGHFERTMRGLRGCSWEGVAGPGHTWAIDSTIGDIYLRSSINRAWIVGRPIVYVIVDVWSTAIVGFYVCLSGPSWDTAKTALFSCLAPADLMGELWGYAVMLSLDPWPTLPGDIWCDRGEYLCRGARLLGADLCLNLSYTPPYRPDLKGLVEVLHRVEKDQQFLFIPGAVDFRRQEFDLRRGFRPTEATLTVREYVAVLHQIFTQYNLAANREHRLDAFMRAAGVFPSPAGLWRWGHQVGIGFQRALPFSELVTKLLPNEPAIVNRNGVRFAGSTYGATAPGTEQWTALARNFGNSDIQVSYFPGSVSRVWTAIPGTKGVTDLKLVEHSGASPESTFDEVADAYMFSKLSSERVEHERVMVALKTQRNVLEIVERAKRSTADALAGTSPGPIPVALARRLDAVQISGNLTSSPAAEAPQRENADVLSEHVEMMRSIMQAASAEAEQ